MAATRIRKGPSGTFVDVGGGSDEGVTSVRWVDPATTLDPSDQTGSAIAPYSTLAAAMASLQLAAVDEVVGTIICADGDYLDEGLTWTVAAEDQVLEVMGFGNARNLGAFVIAGETGTLKLDRLGVGLGFSLTTDISAEVQLTDCVVGAITGASLRISLLESCRVTGAVAIDGIEKASNSQFQDTLTIAGSGGLEAADCFFQGAVTSDQNVILTDCSCAALVSAPAAVTFVARDTVFSNGLVYSVLEATDCHFTSGVEGTELDGGAALIQGGRCDLIVTSTGALQLYDVVFGGVGEQSANISCDSAIINGCLLNGDLAVVGELQIDSTTYQQAVDGFTVTYGTLQISDPPLSINLSVIVPAVGAAAVGYVDTTLVGTDLEDVFSVNDPVTVNPQSDLVAAGAGGGFINARISAVNTLRCAFVGALAGGAASFTVARVR